MWLIPIYIFIVLALVYLTLATIYLLVFAVAYFFVKEPEAKETGQLNRFAILVPAHNEELLISKLCESLLKVNYPQEYYEIYIIADNCNDKTAEICSTFPVNVLVRKNPTLVGKGYALDWGLKKVPLDNFDAVFIVDADNTVDSFILHHLNQSIKGGEQAIQCYNSVGNREDSWFTQLLFVARTIGNQLYHHAKYKMGLSSYLMGNGLCFTTWLLKERGWTAFSAGEDWEYYAQLVQDNIKIGFAAKAKVFHQESRSLNQATSQRLRWSSGRFHIAKTLGLKLFLKGLKEKNWPLLDASLPLIFPNYSLQINLTLVTLLICSILPLSFFKYFSVGLCIGLISGQFLLFLAGVFIAGSPWKVFKAVLHAPLFLGWKMIIDLLSFTGLYRGDKWVRTERHKS